MTPSLKEASAAASASRRVAYVVAVAWFMQNLDTTIVVTSLPQIAASLHVAPVDVTLGVTAYLVAGAALIPVGGWLADRLGARRVFASAIVLFVLASVACAASPTLWVFVLARIAQGAAGALMLPVGRILVLRSTAKDYLLQATALITWPGLIAPVIAPVLGGALTTWVGWQAIFLVNVPIGVIGVVLVLLLVPDDGERRETPLDTVGALLLLLALGASIAGMSGIAQAGALAIDLTLFAVGVLLGAVAVWWFRRAAHPLIDLAPLRVSTYVTATLTGGNAVRIAISATPFLLPLVAQEAWGVGTLVAGQVVLVYMLGNLVMKAITTPLLKAWGFRNVAVWNGLVVAGSIAALGVMRMETSTVLVWVVAFIAGAARSLEFSALNTLTFADIGNEHRTSASTIFSMMQQIALAIGVALAAIMLTVQGGGGLTQADFTLAFAATAVLALAGALHMLRLERDAGHEVTGRRLRGRSR